MEGGNKTNFLLAFFVRSDVDEEDEIETNNGTARIRSETANTAELVSGRAIEPQLPASF